jgi:hypothetical protein
LFLAISLAAFFMAIFVPAVAEQARDRTFSRTNNSQPVRILSSKGAQKRPLLVSRGLPDGQALQFVLIRCSYRA